MKAVGVALLLFALAFLFGLMVVVVAYLVPSLDNLATLALALMVIGALVLAGPATLAAEVIRQIWSLRNR